MSLRELTDVLTALVFYDFLLSFMLTSCDGCIKSDRKSPLVAEENNLFSSFQKNIFEFLGLNEQAQMFGLGSFDLKFYRLTKINGKAENYAITTQQFGGRELPIEKSAFLKENCFLFYFDLHFFLFFNLFFYF